VSRYIDEHRGRFDVEPICRVLDVSASAYYHRASSERSQRVIEDERLTCVIREVHEANYCAYGYRRMWKALHRAGEPVGRDRVKRLMRQAGIHGAKRRYPKAARPARRARSIPRRRPLSYLRPPWRQRIGSCWSPPATRWRSPGSWSRTSPRS
jgi:hypothetical protein